MPAFDAAGSDPEAQRWLGWSAAHPPAVPPGPVELPLRRRHGILRPQPNQLFFAGIDRQSLHLVAAITLYQGTSGRLEIGGSVTAGHRGKGFGTEALTAACDLVHHHFGIPAVAAGCETTNTASIAWLRASGFARVDGPPTHRLPDGREIPSLWWVHVSPRPRRRCPWL